MNTFFPVVIICLLLYPAACTILYFLQEKFIFFPAKLPANHIFNFEGFEEINLKGEENIILNSILFRSAESKGVVFFLHGNAGAIDDWGQGASLFVENGYDVLYTDYRGYGKSTGTIISEKQLVADAQIVYDYLKKKYAEDKIIVSGTSIGSGIAAEIAALNNPHRLILNSPYYSLRSLIKEKVPVIPALVIKYLFETYKYLQKVRCPIIIFHGSKDEVIPVKHSMNLKNLHLKIDLNILEGYGHNNYSGCEAYLKKTKEILQ